ncbi:MAG: 1-acyl-sn-glycerol-3-phosphate acyltransferase, partial [Moorea sp. SIO2B7]|nr:1-acyl-sn-glycerol-3-phosphate acyltransferase [Moorena sp. SIO2B7]
QREREPLASLVLYHLFKWSVVSPMLHAYFRGRIYGSQKVSQSGPLVVVSNHASYFDPPILSCCLRRPVAFMAKEELFKIPVLKQGIELYGAYPVNRSAADRSAIRAAVNALKEGWAAGIFLQGTRTSDGRITAPKLGAAMIAAKAKAPLLPVSLWGTDKILSKGSSIPKPVPVTVRIGELIEAPNSTKRQELQEITEKCTAVINQMHDLGR